LLSNSAAIGFVMSSAYFVLIWGVSLFINRSCSRLCGAVVLWVVNNDSIMLLLSMETVVIL
jgi:hypothetical protein